jgi:hypothetical protein
MWIIGMLSGHRCSRQLDPALPSTIPWPGTWRGIGGRPRATGATEIWSNSLRRLSRLTRCLAPCSRFDVEPRRSVPSSRFVALILRTAGCVGAIMCFADTAPATGKKARLATRHYPSLPTITMASRIRPNNLLALPNRELASAAMRVAGDSCYARHEVV